MKHLLTLRTKTVAAFVLLCILAATVKLTAQISKDAPSFSFGESVITVKNGAKAEFYTSLGTAVSHAVSGDTLYLPAGNLDGYSPVFVNKRLTIVGSGNAEICVGSMPETQIASQIIFQEGADGSLLTGCELSEISFGYIPQDSPPGHYNDNISNVTIMGNIIDGNISFGVRTDGNPVNHIYLSGNVIYSPNLQGKNSTECTVNNNLFLGSALTALNNSLITNNVFKCRTPNPLQGGGQEENYSVVSDLTSCTVQNSYFTCGSVSNCETSIVNNNAFGVSTVALPLSSANNLFEQSLEETFGIASINASTDLHVLDGSACKNAGSDGSDIGIYGGENPYRGCALPFNPYILTYNAAAVEDENEKLHVELTAQARNGGSLAVLEYWFNGNREQITTITVPSQENYSFVEDIDVSTLTQTDNTIYLRIMDEYGVWSGVLTSEFGKRPHAGFSFVAGLDGVYFNNESQFATSYRWDFSDGTVSYLTNPKYYYLLNGTYQVKLIAQNNFCSDTIVHAVTIDTKGIKLITPNTVGRDGTVTCRIYGDGIGNATQVVLQNDGDQIVADTVVAIQEQILSVRFDTKGKTPGIYDLEVTVPDEVLNQTAAFRVETFTVRDIKAEIISDRYHTWGRPKTFEFKIINNGNVDAEKVPVSIYLDSNVLFTDDLDNLAIQPQPLIPIISANSDVSVNYKITSSGHDYTLAIMPQQTEIDEESLKYLLIKMAKALQIDPSTLDINSFAACTYPIIRDKLAEFLSDESNEYNPWQSHKFDWLREIIYATISCGADFLIGPDNWEILKFLYEEDEKEDNDKNQPWDFRFLGFDAQVLYAYDPNRLSGVVGFGDNNYIQLKPSLYYTVYFENDAEKATAPAQEILILDTLDLTKFDANDFSFGSFTFRDTTIEAIPGSAEFSRDIDLRPRGENVIVRLTATFDRTTGIIRCHYIAFDPWTMNLTENPFLGVLYPNETSPEGEGSFSYRIGLRPEITDGDIITNQAHIIFDLNEPMATNRFVNIIDTLKPVSTMSYEHSTGLDYIVSWNGTDTGSGIKKYKIYISENGEDYVLWRSTAETSDTLVATLGSAYRFYCIATDNTGNEEDLKTFQIEFTAELNAIENADLPRKIEFFPNPARNELNISSLEKINRIDIYSTAGQLLQTETDVKTKINISTLQAGIYLINIITENRSVTDKLVVK
jgi:PKD repeat protein